MTVTPYLNNKPHKNGLFAIMIRVTQNRKHKYVSSEIYIKKAYYKKGAKWGSWVRETHPEAHKLNKELEKKLTKVRDHYQETGLVNPKAAISGALFFPFAKDFIRKYDNQESRGTHNTYNSTLNKLEAFAGDKITFNDLTVNFIRNFVLHLKKPKKDKNGNLKPGNDVNTIGVNLKKIRAVISQAVKEDVIEYSKNPFLKIQIENKRTNKEKLTESELDSIRDLDLEGWRLDARNIFLFCLNCMGMRIGSALRLKQNQVINGVLQYQMNKGGKMKTINLTSEALNIASQYKAKRTYLFPYLEGTKDVFKQVGNSTVVINAALKKIAEEAGIDKKITTHIAKHSFTKLGIDAGIDLPTISKMLGHSNLKTTQIYVGEISDVAGNAALEKIFKKD